MYQLIYLSSARTGLTPDGLKDIVEKSRDRNRAADVTGVAFMLDRIVLQLLEGPEAAVRATYARIKQDSRHGAVSIMLSRHCETRSFPGQDMLFAAIDHDDEASAQLTLNLLRARHAERMRAIDDAA